MTGFGENCQNGRFWAKMGYFLQFLPRKGENKIFFGKKRKCHFLRLIMPQLCAKKLAKSYDRIWRN